MKLAIGNKRYSSWSLRPWLAMKHFEIPFEEVFIPLDLPSTTAAILQVSPSGRVPALNDNGLQVWDSLAICEYLAERFPDRRWWPAGIRERATARSLAAEMHSGFSALRELCPMKVGEKFAGFQISAAATADVARIDQLWTRALDMSGGPYLFGAFSIADAMYAPIAFRAQTYGLSFSARSKAYVELLLAHPHMREWADGAQAEVLRMPRYE